MKEFDENEAIEFIKSRVAEAQVYSDDDLLLLLDTIFEYDESLTDDAPDECFEVSMVSQYVVRHLKRDTECEIRPEHVPALVEAEQEYEDSLWDEE